MDDEQIRINIATHLERELHKRGWSRYRLHKESGESQQTIANLLKAETNATVTILARIAHVLDVKIDDLIAPVRGGRKRQKQLAG